MPNNPTRYFSVAIIGDINASEITAALIEHGAIEGIDVRETPDANPNVIPQTPTSAVAQLAELLNDSEMDAHSNLQMHLLAEAVVENRLRIADLEIKLGKSNKDEESPAIQGYRDYLKMHGDA